MKIVSEKKGKYTEIYMFSLFARTAKESIARRRLYERTRRGVELVTMIVQISLQAVPGMYSIPILYAAYRACMGTYDVEDSWNFVFSFWFVQHSCSTKYLCP